MVNILLARSPIIDSKLLNILSKYSITPNVFYNKMMIKISENIILPRFNQELNLVIKKSPLSQFFEVAVLPFYIDIDYYDIVDEVLQINYEKKIINIHENRYLEYSKKTILVLCKVDFDDICIDMGSLKPLKDLLLKYRLCPWFFNQQTMVRIGAIILPRYDQELNKILSQILSTSSNVKHVLNVRTINTVCDSKYISIVECKVDNIKSEIIGIDYDRCCKDLFKNPY